MPHYTIRCKESPPYHHMHGRWLQEGGGLEQRQHACFDCKPIPICLISGLHGRYLLQSKFPIQAGEGTTSGWEELGSLLQLQSILQLESELEVTWMNIYYELAGILFSFWISWLTGHTLIYLLDRRSSVCHHHHINVKRRGESAQSHPVRAVDVEDRGAALEWRRKWIGNMGI